MFFKIQKISLPWHIGYPYRINDVASYSASLRNISSHEKSRILRAVSLGGGEEFPNY